MRIAAAVLALAAAAAAGGCGSDDGELRVSAASSLKRAFTEYGGARFSFAGSDQLAAQIRRGARPDVFAAADPDLPRALEREGLVERPVVFAANRLAIAVRSGSRIRALEQLAEPGVRVAMAGPSVPAGAYAREAVERAGPRVSRGVLANVRSEEPDVSGVVGKVLQGAADAGIVYVTDVQAAGGRLTGIELPPRLRPRVEYAAAVVRGAANPGDARAWVRGLLGPEGRRALDRAGFEAP